MIRLKVYEQGKDVLVAACDADLLGRTFREGEVRLHVKPSFYDGIAVTHGQLVDHLRLATVGNLVGEETVRVALEAGLIQEAGVMYIDGVPHAQLVVV